MKKVKLLVTLGVILAVICTVAALFIVNPEISGWFSGLHTRTLTADGSDMDELPPDMSVQPGHTVIPLKQISAVQEYIQAHPEAEVVWSSNASEIARVGKYGEIYGVSEGVCSIFATVPYSTDSSENPDETQEDTVITAVRVQVVPETDGGDLAGIYVLRITEFEPTENASENLPGVIRSARPGVPEPFLQAFSWISGNPAIAQVTENGAATFLVAGPITFFALDAEDNELFRISMITYIGATIPVEEISPRGNITVISMNHSKPLTVEFEPAYATQKSLIWSSDDPDTVEVDSKGNAHGKKEGICTVTATSAVNPLLTADFKVRIVAMPTESVEFTRKRTEVEVGGTKIPKYTLLPEIGSFQTPVFETSDPAIATVSEDGVIKGISQGSCTVTARAQDNPNLRSEIEVSVVTKSYIPDDGMRVVVYMGSQSVGVYQDGEILKEFICSTGVPGMDTPIGTYHVLYKGTWMYFKNALCYVKYGLVFHGNYVLHSVPYKEARNDGMYVSSYLKLGRVASHGCVRFAISDVRWLYYNVDVGTEIVITRDSGPSVAAPPYPSLGGDSQGLGWDPTDPDPGNPYNR